MDERFGCRLLHDLHAAVDSTIAPEIRLYQWCNLVKQSIEQSIEGMRFGIESSICRKLLNRAKTLLQLEVRYGHSHVA
jgi:hypothetical protein